MELTKEKIEELAKLYCFQLTEKEVEEILIEFQHLIQNMALLNQIDTEAVEPMVYPFEQATSYLREDDVIHELSVQQVLENAPKVENDYFVVPKVVD